MVTVGKSEQASDSTDGGYFALNATNLLAGWLHAAALSDGIRAATSWTGPSTNGDDAPDPHPGQPSAGRQRHRQPCWTPCTGSRPTPPAASLWTTAQTAMAPLLSPAARAVFTPA